MITRFRRGIDGRMHEDDNGEWVRYREAASPAALDRPCRHAYPHDGPCEAEAASPAALDVRRAIEEISGELSHYDLSDDPGYIKVPTERVRAILLARLSPSEGSGE